MHRFDPLSKQRAVVRTHCESMRIPTQGENSPARFTRRFTCHGNSFGELIDSCSFANPHEVFFDPHMITIIWIYKRKFALLFDRTKINYLRGRCNVRGCDASGGVVLLHRLNPVEIVFDSREYNGVPIAFTVTLRHKSNGSPRSVRVLKICWTTRVDLKYNVYNL